MDGLRIQQERAHNLWTSVQRKTPPLGAATTLDPNPQVEPRSPRSITVMSCAGFAFFIRMEK